jgi:hypothetical protein
MKKDLASGLWHQYRDTTAIRKAEDFAKFTLPSLMVDPLCRTDTTAEVLEYDFQSDGSLLVNNLTAKLALALFPPGRPSFQVELSPDLMDAAAAKGVDAAALSGRTSELERLATRRLFMNASLSKLHRAIKLLIVTGNVLMYRDSRRGKFMVWSMQSYTIRRTPMGDPLCVVLRQQMPFSTLPLTIQNDAAAKQLRPIGDAAVVDLYTVIEWINVDDVTRRCEVWQELDGKRVGPISTYPEHLCPWVPVAWSIADGEHLGRGYVEEYCGHFAKLSLLSEQLGLYELESLNVLNLVDEAAGSAVDDYRNADTGDYVPGKVDGIKSYERGDYNKINAISNSLTKVVQALNRAFMYTGQVRDAERVTVEEIRTTAQEAENLLGGAYSLLAESLQAPLAYLTMAEVAQDTGGGLLLGVMNKSFRPTILTGIPALTRNAQTQNIMRATQEAASIVPALGQLSKRFDTEKVIDIIFNNNSVDLESMSKDPDQIAAEAMQEEAQAMATLDVASGAVAATQAIPGVLGQ